MPEEKIISLSPEAKKIKTKIKAQLDHSADKTIEIRNEEYVSLLSEALRAETIIPKLLEENRKLKKANEAQAIKNKGYEMKETTPAKAKPSVFKI